MRLKPFRDAIRYATANDKAGTKKGLNGIDWLSANYEFREFREFQDGSKIILK